MQENRPLIPWIVEGALKFFEIAHHPETALGIGMIERTGDGRWQLLHRRRYASGQIKERLGGLGRQVICQIKHRGFRGPAHVAQPLDRHAVAE